MARTEKQIMMDLDSLILEYHIFHQRQREFSPEGRRAKFAEYKRRLVALRGEARSLRGQRSALQARMEKLRDLYQGRTAETTRAHSDGLESTRLYARVERGSGV